MLVTKKDREEVYQYLFKEGVMVARKDFKNKHSRLDVPNIVVLELMRSFVSRSFVKEQYAWRHYYWYLTNEGIEYLRTYLHLPAEIVPSTLKKTTRAPQTQRPAEGERPPRMGRGGGVGGGRDQTLFGNKKEKVKDMGGAQSAHAHHHHHKAISSRIKKTYAEDGVIVLSDEELKHLWSHYDDNKNNLLDLHELHLLVADLVEHTIEDPAERDTVKSKINENGDFVDALFKQLDLNGDGVVEFHEFTKAYHKVLEHYLANH